MLDRSSAAGAAGHFCFDHLRAALAIVLLIFSALSDCGDIDCHGAANCRACEALDAGCAWCNDTGRTPNSTGFCRPKNAPADCIATKNCTKGPVSRSVGVIAGRCPLASELHIQKDTDMTPPMWRVFARVPIYPTPPNGAEFLFFFPQVTLRVACRCSRFHQNVQRSHNQPLLGSTFP